VILEVGRRGLERPGESENVDATHLAACRDAVQRLPHRTDLKLRLANLLEANGSREEAILLLRRVAESQPGSVRLYSDLGWMLFREKRYHDAAFYLDAASKLPDAESTAARLQAGAAEATARATGEIAPSPAVEKRGLTAAR
jgi:Tfp pilus assembly protein PilF